MTLLQRARDDISWIHLSPSSLVEIRHGKSPLVEIQYWCATHNVSVPQTARCSHHPLINRHRLIYLRVCWQREEKHRGPVSFSLSLSLFEKLRSHIRFSSQLATWPRPTTLARPLRAAHAAVRRLRRSLSRSLLRASRGSRRPADTSQRPSPPQEQEEQEQQEQEQQQHEATWAIVFVVNVFAAPQQARGLPRDAAGAVAPPLLRGILRWEAALRLLFVALPKLVFKRFEGARTLVAFFFVYVMLQALAILWGSSSTWAPCWART